MSCSRTTVSQSHSIQQESQNHQGRFTSAGNPHATAAQPEPCDSLPKDKSSWGSHCLWGEAKNLSVGQYLSSKLFKQTHCPCLCFVPPTQVCSAVASHKLCCPTLPCSTHPTIHILPMKSMCALRHHHHTPQTTYLGQRGSLYG